MSIPQICPSCGHHISTAHAKDCCYGSQEYAHIGWPSYQVDDGVSLNSVANPVNSAGILMMGDDTATAIRRLLEYLEEEPEPAFGPEDLPSVNSNERAVLLLAKRAEELRKEASGIYIVEARAKRNFAADVLDGIIQEMRQ